MDDKASHLPVTPVAVRHTVALRSPLPGPVPDTFAPLAPKVAILEPGEHHFYSVGIVPHVYKRGSFLAGRLPNGYCDGTRLAWHLTDRRLPLTAITSDLLAG